MTADNGMCVCVCVCNSEEQNPSWVAKYYVELVKFPAFSGTRRFITVFTISYHCPYPEPGESNSHIPSNPISRRSISILSYYLRLNLPSGLLPSDFTTRILYEFLISPLRATCSAHTYIYIKIELKQWYRTFYLKNKYSQRQFWTCHRWNVTDSYINQHL
jgi:hypothetical protein